MLKYGGGLKMKLKGIHHVSAMTADASKNVEFYTRILGMRLVKKTVNQDDTTMYHLFYGDEKGNPGTELTFFEIPMAAANHNGTNSISAISLRVKNDLSLSYWRDRLDEYKVNREEVKQRAGRKTLRFQDFEGQRFILVSDEQNEGVASGVPWNKGPVPQEFGITGLGPIRLTVPNAAATIKVLTEIMGFLKIGSYSSASESQPDILVFETGEGGTGAEVHVEERSDLQRERLGRGGVHHVAFRADNEEELRNWIERIQNAGFPNSGFVDRFYFRSLYFREPNGILFEIATDGPGFDTDEDIDQLGESLALPPFLESRREEIEARLKPIKK